MPINLSNNELNSLGTQFANQKGVITSGSILYLDAGMAASYPGSGTTWTDLAENGFNSTLINGWWSCYIRWFKRLCYCWNF
jgi:hypothetical protein